MPERRGGVVRTVRGDIPAGSLGVTATHEHLWCDQRLAPKVELFGATRRDRFMVLDDYDLVRDEVLRFRAAGGEAIVELTANGWGRDPRLLSRLSEDTGVHIIAISGLYVEACMPLWVHDADIDELAAFFAREVTEGIEDTGIRAGVLKSAISWPYIEGVEERVARAVARAHLLTGAPITTHSTGSMRFESDGGGIGLRHLEIFAAEGVSPDAVITGHVDERPNLPYLVALAQTGTFVQFDVIGKEHYILDETRADLVAALFEHGFGDRILLSTDRNRVYELHAGGGVGYDHVLRSFVPKLRQRGLGDPEVRMLLVDNPARALALRDPAGAAKRGVPPGGRSG